MCKEVCKLAIDIIRHHPFAELVMSQVFLAIIFVGCYCVYPTPYTLLNGTPVESLPTQWRSAIGWIWFVFAILSGLFISLRGISRYMRHTGSRSSRKCYGPN